MIKKPETVQTTIHAYTSNTGATERERALLEAKRKIITFSISPDIQKTDNYRNAVLAADGTVVTLETEFLFDNQWNCVELGRVFDAVRYVEHTGRTSHLIYGQYLDITPAMIEVREREQKCGYCGAGYWDGAACGYCVKCLGTKYLKREDLHLLQLLPVARSSGAKRALTANQLAECSAAYDAAQAAAFLVRAEKKRIDARHAAEVKFENARIERDAILWLLDHGIDPDNCIYYPHTGRFCFGWREPLTDEAFSELTTKLGAEFPFDYDAKRASAA
jgi:hypothetical protein